VLRCELSGAKVYLVGTAHFSKESCEDVSLVIQATQPDIVMVELCKQVAYMYSFILAISLL
jgi:pheromone shutdown protein TraB